MKAPMVRIFHIIAFAALVFAGSSRAEETCPDPVKPITEDIKGKIDGSLDTLIKLGRPKAADDVETITKDVLHEYPNADKVALQQNTLAILCNKILPSPDFPPEFKQRVFEKLIAMATIRNLKIDRSKVNELGLTMESVRDTMALLVREHYVNRFNRDGRSYEVIQQVPVTPQTLAQYYVTTPSGQQVPLSNPVTYEIGD